MTVAEQWTGPITHHGEGPVWDTRLDALRCVDMLAGDVLTIREGVEVDRLHLGDVAAVWRPRVGGGSVVAVDRGFVVIDELGARAVIGPLWDDAAVRMNEGACAPDGSFYCGSMDFDATPGRGTLWRLSPDRSVMRVLDNLTISNGLAFTSDGRRAYYIDSPTRRVDVLTFSELGVIAERTVFADLSGARGEPDGLALDAEGGLWVAMWGGGAVQHVWPDGSLGEAVAVGVSQPSAVCFGGPGFDQLYVTTSRYGLASGAEPQAGAVFVAGVRVEGAPVPGYAG